MNVLIFQDKKTYEMFKADNDLIIRSDFVAYSEDKDFYHVVKDFMFFDDKKNISNFRPRILKQVLKVLLDDYEENIEPYRIA